MGKIRVAIAGVGNCASSLIQGCVYYTNKDNPVVGLLHAEFGGYHVSDIEFVAAFDVDKRKVGNDLSVAINAGSNCTKEICDVSVTGVIVQKAPILDGVADHMRQTFLVDESQKECDVIGELERSGADMLICYLPVGSAKAARFYAQAAIDAGIGFINAIPEFICSDDEWIDKFREKGLPCAGDDIKSQVGATIIHRVLSRLIEDRGQVIDSTFQLNVGGNSDFENMLDQNRLLSKRKSKTQAVTSILDGGLADVRIGPSDFIPHLKDNKVCYINIKGRQFGNIPFEVDLKLSVEDSPNSAGIMVDVIRAMKIALDNGESGHLEEISSLMFKSPKKQVRDDVAKEIVRGKYQL
ncbi:MAG: inositol-3-phosphate synthase [Candidatus Moranbacteria bacterium]|nr:inositol-3-phosphate synthase [Candidatus Moranbacteria bacterium]